MGQSAQQAPGWPGSPARWSSSAKSGVGTAAGNQSRVWFTLSHGILNEIYYPRVDQACTRDPGLIVTDGTSFFSEEKRHARSEVRQIEDGVPAYRLHALLAPHLANRAAGFLVRNGPVTGEARWEEEGGYAPFRLAAEIAALLAAADIAELHAAAPGQAAYLRETADCWNDQIERWTYATGTALAARLGVNGYYVRIAPPETAEGASPVDGFVPIKDRPPDQAKAPAAAIVSPDALALVRFGLRAADDPRIVDTVKVVDALLKIETPNGPCWTRYNEDGYGEHADGAPFDGTGIGRAWPLLTGERAHHELAAGRRQQAEALLHAMEAFASDGGLVPEQVWDDADPPKHELFFGRPSGSAMPLAWAHAKHVKLLRSLRDGRVFDLPPQTVQRYLVDKTSSPFLAWRHNHKIRTIPQGRALRVETREPALVHWSADGWRTVSDTPSRDTGLRVHVADLPTSGLRAGAQILFTLRWLPGRWEGVDHTVSVA